MSTMSTYLRCRFAFAEFDFGFVKVKVKGSNFSLLSQFFLFTKNKPPKSVP